jgi:CBS domain containing-hemolysin-like protein
VTALIVETILVVTFTAVSGMLAAVEAAFYLLKRRRLSHVALQNPRAELVNRYLQDPPTLLMPVHMGTYTAHVAMTVLLISLLFDALGQWSIPVVFLFMVVYLLVFRLSVPYTLVRRNPERSLLVLLPVFHPYAQALAPLVAALRKRAAGESALAALDETKPPRFAAPEVPPAPVHDPDEGRLVEAVARFAETLVRDVMTPRPDIVAVAAAATMEELRRVFRETKYSRVPLYGENLDDIVGVAVVRDLVEYDGDGSDPAASLARPAFVVPETKKIAELLKEFQAGRNSFAVVINEYGGTAGLVTVEDIVEEIVGEIKDEYDVEAEPISVEHDGSVVVAGRVKVDRLEQALEAPLVDGEDVSTVGGLVTAVFGRVPRPGESVDYRGFAVEVIDAEGKRVNRVRFRRKAEAPPA